jgi:hypothetical protein
MTDFAPYQKLNFAFASLLADLSKTWPARDIAYVQDIVSHAEYGEALENLVAIGQRNGKGFSPDQLRQISAIATAMGMEQSSLPKHPEGPKAPLPQPTPALRR